MMNVGQAKLVTESVSRRRKVNDVVGASDAL
jgi:hypothetical protein